MLSTTDKVMFVINSESDFACALVEFIMPALGMILAFDWVLVNNWLTNLLRDLRGLTGV